MTSEDIARASREFEKQLGQRTSREYARVLHRLEPPIRREPRDEEPANKPFQIAAIRRMFQQLNPEIDSQTVDFSSYVDPSLHMPENIAILREAFPTYRWEAAS